VITVVDYGVNNIRNVVRAFAAGGHLATLTADPEVVRNAERVLLPGVGNFGRGAATLAETGLGDALRDVAAAGRPVMGICLGLQLFFGTSEEAPGAQGLGLFDGRVRRFSDALPVPHLGWAEVAITAGGAAHPVLAALAGTPQYFYHVHSYHPADVADASVLAECDYGGRFPAIVGRDNVIGAQFHPEKSQRAGIAVLDAFARWAP
jgi:imidazole glycerol phosphate synthase glutamine amidotransferase subunit